MVEAEIAFVEDLDTIIRTIEGLLRHSASTLLDKCSADLELYARATKGKSNIKNIEKFLSSEIVVMSYREAVELLTRSSEVP